MEVIKIEELEGYFEQWKTYFKKYKQGCKFRSDNFYKWIQKILGDKEIYVRLKPFLKDIWKNNLKSGLNNGTIIIPESDKRSYLFND